MGINDLTDSIIKKLVKVKDVIFLWKQGEALERASRPYNEEEALGLGNFDPYANLALNALILYEKSLNQLCSTEEEQITDTILSEFAYNVAIASGSKGALRLEKTLETIGLIKQAAPSIPERSSRQGEYQQHETDD